MKRNYLLLLVAIVLAVHTIPGGLIVNGAAVKARPKINLDDPFYKGQLQYDDSLTETPIGTIVYAIDDESVEVDPFDSDNMKTFQLQDVVTHGNPNDKSFINHNLFTIGDGNDAIIDNGSDEDDDIDDTIDIDGAVDKHAASHSKFANFAFNDEKHIPLKTDANMHSKPTLSGAATASNPDQGQQQTANAIAAHSPNRQLTHKHSNKTSTRTHGIHNHKFKPHDKWYRRHQKWLQHKAKAHHHRNRHHGSQPRNGWNQRRNNSNKPNAQSPTYVQAHVSFYDSSFDDTLNSNRFVEGKQRPNDKWPHLKKLQSELHEDMLSDSLPPYIKKYNRRNKQLIGLLEGQGMPNFESEDAKQPSRRRQKQNNQWMEKNLFEEQIHDKKNDSTKVDEKSIEPIILNSKQRYLTEKNVQNEANGLPGEHLSLSSEEYNCEGDSDCIRMQHPRAGHIKKPQITPRADSFLFHRVASPKLVGTASIAGGLIKQKLPIVAVTAKRIEEVRRQARTKSVQNTFPLP